MKVCLLGILWLVGLNLGWHVVMLHLLLVKRIEKCIFLLLFYIFCADNGSGMHDSHIQVLTVPIGVRAFISILIDIII